jgi:hypothetical protein
MQFLKTEVKGAIQVLFKVQLLYQMIYIGQRFHLRLLKSDKLILVGVKLHLGLVPLCPCPIAHIPDNTP